MTAPSLRSTLRDSVTVPAASPRSPAARLVAVATLTVVCNLIADLLYAVSDPRIRYA